jgi:hypothetical protein
VRENPGTANAALTLVNSSLSSPVAPHIITSFEGMRAACRRCPGEKQKKRWKWKGGAFLTVTRDPVSHDREPKTHYQAIVFNEFIHKSYHYYHISYPLFECTICNGFPVTASRYRSSSLPLAGTHLDAEELDLVLVQQK